MPDKSGPLAERQAKVCPFASTVERQLLVSLVSWHYKLAWQIEPITGGILFMRAISGESLVQRPVGCWTVRCLGYIRFTFAHTLLQESQRLEISLSHWKFAFEMQKIHPANVCGSMRDSGGQFPIATSYANNQDSALEICCPRFVAILFALTGKEKEAPILEIENYTD